MNPLVRWKVEHLQVSLPFHSSIFLYSNAISLTYQRQVTDTSPQVKNALSKGVKGMLYSGDIDMACNFLMGQRFSRKIGLPV